MLLFSFTLAQRACLLDAVPSNCSPFSLSLSLSWYLFRLLFLWLCILSRACKSRKELLCPRELEGLIFPLVRVRSNHSSIDPVAPLTRGEKETWFRGRGQGGGKGRVERRPLCSARRVFSGRTPHVRRGCLARRDLQLERSDCDRTRAGIFPAERSALLVSHDEVVQRNVGAFAEWPIPITLREFQVSRSSFKRPLAIELVTQKRGNK